MSNKYLWCLLTTMMWVMLIGFSSCGKSEETGSAQQPGGQRTDPKEVTEDPEGTIEVSMSVDGNTLGGLKIDKERNFISVAMENPDTYYQDIILFASTGSVYGLGNVNYIPTSGWSYKLAVREGYGYIGYIYGTQTFFRMYVEPVETVVEGSHDSGYNTDGGYYQTETTTSRNFYIVKYQSPFKGTDEEIMVPSATMSFSAEGGTQTLTFTNNNIVPFTFESSQDWCRVTTSSTNEANIPDGIAVTVDATTSNKEETAIVTLTTLYGKEKEITVTRAATGTIIQPDGSFEIPAFSAINNEPRMLYFSSNSEQSELTVSANESWCHVTLSDLSASEIQNARQVQYIGKKKVASYQASNGHYYQLQVSVDDNATETGREAEITLKSKDGNASYTIPVLQNGFELRLRTSELQVGASATQSRIEIIGDVPMNLLQASSNASWCKTSIIDATTNPNDNLGERRYLLCDIDANTSDESRSAIVTLKMKNGRNVHTLNVTQEGLSLIVSNTKISFDRQSNYTTVTVTSNYSGWTPISSDDSWCKVSWTYNTLTIRVDPTTENREATISFEGFKEKIIVKQNRYAVGDSFNEDNLSGTVGYISFDRCFIYKSVGSHAWSTEAVPTGATSMSNGQANMNIIKKIPDYEKYYPAFAACDALNVDGITGWYMPAYTELRLFRPNDYNKYWSSTERETDYSYGGGYYSEWLNNARFYYSKKNSNYTTFAIHLFE